MWSEQELINQFKLEKPDYILLIHRTTYDYGKPFFGVDYASDFFQIIKNEYQSKALFGAEPFSSPQFGIQLLKLKNKHLM